MNGQDWKLAAKVMAVCLSIFVFLGACFCAVNNTRSAMTGESVSVSRTTDGFVLSSYHNSYLIRMDLNNSHPLVTRLLQVLTFPPKPLTSWRSLYCPPKPSS